MRFLNEGATNDVSKVLANIINAALKAKGYEIRLRDLAPCTEQDLRNQEERVQQLANEIMKRI